MNNLELIRARLQKRGGVNQQERMIQDKLWTLQHAIKYSYQGARISFTNQKNEYCQNVGALINPNKLSMDYDDKIISIDYQYELRPGSIFTWDNTQTQWIVYTQDLTELAYFKGDIRRCSHTVSWIGSDGQKKTTHMALIGPKGTRLGSLINSNFVLDLPNYTINIILPNNEETIQYFKRYSKFYLQNVKEDNQLICWRVEAIDSITNPGIIEIFAKEYYSNNQTDDLENGLAGALIVAPTITQETNIVGEYLIKPGIEYTYSATGNEGNWEIISNKDKVKIIQIDNNIITIKWIPMYDGYFELQYDNAKPQKIIVESLF